MALFSMGLQHLPADAMSKRTPPKRSGSEAKAAPERVGASQTRATNALVAWGVGAHFDPGHGRLMKEWVTVPAGGVPWVTLAQEAYHFVKTGKAARN